MKIHKLSSTDAFIAFDLDDAPAVGVTRLARKILVDGAQLLARSTTYSFAFFGIQRGGASAGINAEGDARDGAVAAFIDEVSGMVGDGRWVTDPSLGLTEADLAPLRIKDPRPEELWNGDQHRLTADGAVAAAGAARDGGIGGASCAIVGDGALRSATETAIEAAGATVTDGGIDAEADILFVAGKAGVLDHDAAATVRARVVVPLTPVPVTARAHAVLTQAERIHVPDFVAIAAPLLAGAGHDGDPIAAVADGAAEISGAGTGMWMAAIERAESYLSTWQDELPFGRPLA